MWNKEILKREKYTLWNIKVIFFLFLWVVIIFNSGLAIEQEATLKELAQKEFEIIRGPSFWEEAFIESPVPMMTYKKEFLERFGFKNIKNFLDYMPSFYLTSGHIERSITFRGFRSLFSSGVLLMEDFQRLTSPDYENFPVDWAFPLKDLSKVEIMYGAGGALYGGGSFSGVALLERKREKEGISFEAERGEFDEERHLARFSLKDLYLLAQRVRRPQEAIKGLKNYENNLAESFIGKYPLKGGHLSIIYMKENTELDRNLIGDEINPYLKKQIGDEVKVSYLGINLYQEFFFSPFWKIVFIPSYTFFKQEIPTYTSINAFPAYFNKYSPRRLDFLTYISGDTVFGKFLFGAELQKREFRDYSTKFYLITNSTLNEYFYRFRKDDDFMKALFFIYKKTFDQWILNLGARYESYEGYAGKLIPRLGIIYKPIPSLSFLFSYTEGFNIPAFFHKEERSIPLGSFSYKFYKLSPEREKTYQLSTLYSSGKNLKVRGTLFYQNHKNRIWRDSQLRTEKNFPSFNMGGFEFEIAGEKGDHIYFLNYSYFRVFNAKDQPFIYKDDYIVGFPMWMLKGGISLKIPSYPPSFLSPSFKYIGPTRDRYGKVVSDYLIWDLYYTLNLSKNLTFGIKIDNIFDKHFERAGSMQAIPWEGRCASLEVKLDF